MIHYALYFGHDRTLSSFSTSRRSGTSVALDIKAKEMDLKP